MRRLNQFAGCAVALVGLVIGASAAAAQEGNARKPMFGSPVFLLQPGIVTANAVSPTDEDADAVHGFNARFATVIPTATPWFSLVAGVQFQPNGLGGSHNNLPGVFYGGIIPVALLGNMTQGWISLSIDPLGVYGLNSRDSNFPYSHEFFLEGAFVVNIGSKMMTGMGPWSGLGAYLLVDQQITHPAKNIDDDSDYWNPVLLYGLSLPLAPWGK